MNPRLMRKLAWLLSAVLAVMFVLKGGSVAYDQYRTIQDLPRNQILRPFDPHRSNFTCIFETTRVPPIDAEADAWFLEALAMEDPETWEEDRDYKMIVLLTQQAAERRHWKAMLNLASLYLEGRVPGRGVNDAIEQVEEAMRLGIPAAYDRMGIYYSRGIGVPGDATNAFAFQQKAAEMGDPRAMALIGDKLSAVWDSPADGFWANIPIATKMLECALEQGYGPAAYTLAHLRAWRREPNGKRINPRTDETKLLALKTLHEGVRHGCPDCARKLSVEFDTPHDLADMLVPHLDIARSERYAVFNDALDFNPLLRFPNLDKVLPLPPAPLPQWNGDKKDLINIAKAVIPRQKRSVGGNLSQQHGRQHRDPFYILHASGDSASSAHAPFAGYWQPTAPQASLPIQAWLATFSPGLYRAGEIFDKPYYPHEPGLGTIVGLTWQHFLTVPREVDAVHPRGAGGITREIARPEQHLSCEPNKSCPLTGTWQPWLPHEHPLRQEINQPWRQAWVSAKQPFPDLQSDSLGSQDRNPLKWYLMEAEVLSLPDEGGRDEA